MAKNRRKTKGGSRKVECTCDLRYDLDPPRHMDHANTCDLWHLQDFVDGLIDWDPYAQLVVTLSDYVWADSPVDERSDMQKTIDAAISGMPTAAAPSAWSKAWNYQSCRHNMTDVALPDADGTVVYCSASTDVRGRVNRPDYAVYLANSWTAQSISTFVPWEDYGTPYVAWRAVREVVEDWYRRALAGQKVEVGCMGGHGRTGTFLAAVVMLADPNMTPEGAVAWVRKHYCHKAVEDASQKYWLRWFADPSLPAHYDRPAPKKATVVKPTHASVTAKHGPVGGGSEGDSCNWTKNGKWCKNDYGHGGPHHYALTSRRLAVSDEYVAPDADRCIHQLDDGKFRCRKPLGHGDYHSYTAAKHPSDVVACDKGFSGPCTLDAGHDQACLVMRPVHEYCEEPECDRYRGHAGICYMSVSRGTVIVPAGNVTFEVTP